MGDLEKTLSCCLLAKILVPVDVEKKEGRKEAVSLGVCLDELAVQPVVLANLVFRADVNVITELLDVNWVVEIFILKVMHILACCPVEADPSLSTVRSSHVQTVDGQIETIGIVYACVGPHLVEAAFPDIDAELEVLDVVSNLLAKTITDTHTLWVGCLS